MIRSIPVEIIEYLTTQLHFQLNDFSFSSGGCINSGGKLKTDQGIFFLKWNSAQNFPGMFEAEAKGLKLLLQTNVIYIPKVVATASLEQWQFILLEFVEQKRPETNYWENLGQQLASMHQHTADKFGLDHNNYIGSLPQKNTQKDSWIDFFIEHRLMLQVEVAIKHSRINPTIVCQFDQLYKQLPSLLPKEQPSLLHGDLWSGNLITNHKGEPCLIDPAVYYGNREAEIAFTRLFGGFSPSFYESYNENFPLQPGFFERSDVYNLYPLMVHVNLFGGGYVNEVVAILKRLI